MKQFTISPNESGQRFDKYLKKLLSNASGSFVYKMLRKKNITLNDRKADGTEKLNAGDLVKLFLSDETFEKFSGKDETNSGYMKLKSIDSGRLQVVYEDDDVIIINKPSGMLSQKAVPEDISANEYILSYLIRKGALSEEQLKTFKPSICNRLDRNTSGLLIAGKTLKGLQTMAEAFPMVLILTLSWTDQTFLIKSDKICPSCFYQCLIDKIVILRIPVLDQCALHCLLMRIDRDIDWLHISRINTCVIHTG